MQPTHDAGYTTASFPSASSIDQSLVSPEESIYDKLGGLLIDILPVADLEDRDLTSGVVDEKNNSKVALTKSVAIRKARELLAAMRSRVHGESLNLSDDSSPIGLRGDSGQLFASRCLDRDAI